MSWHRLLAGSTKYAVLIAFAAFYLVPFYVMILTGLKPLEDISSFEIWNMPKSLDWGSFRAAWNQMDSNFWNSVRITIPGAIISTFLGSINGYVFAKWGFRGSNVILFLFVFGMFLPGQGILIPLVWVLQFMGLYGKVNGLIMAYCIFGIPITSLLFYRYYASVPDELVDASKIDGCGFFGIYRRIILPLSGPTFAVVGVWQCTRIWNEYLMALVVLGNPARAPVTVAIKNFSSMGRHPLELADGRRADRVRAHNCGLPAAWKAVHARPAGGVVERLVDAASAPAACCLQRPCAGRVGHAFHTVERGPAGLEGSRF